MKGIVSSVDRDRVTRRNQLIVGVVLILVMLFSTIGFAFSFGHTGNVVEEIEYKGVEFSRDSSTGYWTFEKDGVEFFTIYSPEEVSDIDFVNYKKVGNYAGQPLYFIGDPGDGFAELYRTLSNYALRVGGACLDEECEEDYPIKDCGVDNVVIIEDIVNGSEVIEGITTDVNCVYIKAKPENLVRYVDAYLFDLLGLDQGV